MTESGSEFTQSGWELRFIDACGWERSDNGKGVWGKTMAPKSAACRDFTLWLGRGAHFSRNKRFHSRISTVAARNLSIFAMANVRISRARSSWEPRMGQKWCPRAIF